MNAIERLDQTITNFITFIDSIPADKLQPSLSTEWGAREIIIHLVFWHEQYVAILHEVIAGRNPKLLKGTFKEANHGDALYDVAWFTFYEPWYPQFQDLHVSERLLEDFKTDPHTNTADLDARLMCYQLDIGIGSIAYNAFKKIGCMHKKQLITH